MCTYNITLDDALVKQVRPSFADDKALELWLQQQMEDVLVDYYVSHVEAHGSTPPPCQYTVEEAEQRVLQATAEAKSGIGCLSLDEFETLVETW